ncbi:MAG: deoxyguanosinetriphosphate triphosphohydrolase [Candidatus Omnitrophota bacterium]|nr:MAG: deoxyguanosinetriphosphate triphosphohydrolase [Candidatus Omnitrophota bacterium]
MLTRKEIETWEEKTLSPYAMKSRYSCGRKHSEKEHLYRSIYQRDRDRVIHSAAFRRLEYKTQVFVYHEGDYYRTRLTHTLEVAQIARTISKNLRLNEDLTEAIALVHDVGHTPFGHAVEEVLDEFMEEEGGFNHNIQGLRVVDTLEERYPNFRGLNLSWETREGILKHNPRQLQEYSLPQEFNQRQQPTLEVQVMDIADEIAYNNHDLDDGIKSGMITEAELKKIQLWNVTDKNIRDKYSNLNKELRIYLIIRNLIDWQVTDLIKNTLKNIKKFKVADFKDVRSCNRRLAAFNKEIFDLRQELREFLYGNLYCHWRVLRMSDKAKRFVKSLFTVYFNNPDLLPPVFKKDLKDKSKSIKRSICDYIAGMTDRYALEEYKRLFDPYEKV